MDFYNQFRTNNLQNPDKKTMITKDEALKEVFGNEAKEFHQKEIFQVIGKHMTRVDKK